MLIHAPSLAICAIIASITITLVIFGVNNSSNEIELSIEPTPEMDQIGPKKITIDTSMRHMEGGWMFKNKFLRNLLIPQNNFKSLIKSIFPNKKIREGLKQKIMNMSTVETPQLSSAMRNKLKTYYRQDVSNLAKLLNRDLNHWIDKS